MIFTSKKKNKERLLSSFGEVKDSTFDFDFIEKYFRKKNNSSAFQILSDKTCNDLDFQELFMFIDRTNSKVGQQFLYNKLRVIPNASETRVLDEELIARLTNQSELRVNIQRQLEMLSKKDAYYIPSLFQEENLKPPKWFFMVKLLSFTSFLTLIIVIFDADNCNLSQQD